MMPENWLPPHFLVPSCEHFFLTQYKEIKTPVSYKGNYRSKALMSMILGFVFA